MYIIFDTTVATWFGLANGRINIVRNHGVAASRYNVAVVHSSPRRAEVGCTMDDNTTAMSPGETAEPGAHKDTSFEDTSSEDTSSAGTPPDSVTSRSTTIEVAAVDLEDEVDDEEALLRDNVRDLKAQLKQGKANLRKKKLRKEKLDLMAYLSTIEGELARAANHSHEEIEADSTHRNEGKDEEGEDQLDNEEKLLRESVAKLRAILKEKRTELCVILSRQPSAVSRNSACRK
jgi:hypothetical protein